MSYVIETLRTGWRAFTRLVFQGEELPEPELRRLLECGIWGMLVSVTAVLAGILGTAVVRPTLVRQEKDWHELTGLDRIGIEPRPFEFSYLEQQGWMTQSRKKTVYAYSQSDDVVVLSSECTHLGCNVRWNPQTSHFECPCHGGVYDQQGEVVAGPPPRRLARLPVTLQDGKILIRRI